MPENEKDNQESEVAERTTDVEIEQGDGGHESVVTDATVDDTPTVSGHSFTPAKPSRKISKKAALLVSALVLLLAGAGIWGFVLRKHGAAPKTTSTTPPVAVPPVAEQTPPVDKENEDLLAKFTKPTTGEVWLAAPKKLANLGYVKDNPDAEYYEVGTHGDKKILMSVVSDIGDDVRLYEKGTDGKVVFVSQPDAFGKYTADNIQYYKQSVPANVTVDTAIHYDSLTVPKSLDLGNGYSVKRAEYPGLGDFIRLQSTPMSRVKQYGPSSIVVSERTDATTKLTSIGYLVQLPIGTRVSVTYEPLDLDMKGYKWQRGAQTVINDKLSPMTRGCGFLTSVTRAEALTDGDVIEAGTSTSGLKIFEAKNSDYVLVTKAYEEFNQFFEGDPTYKYHGISKAEFVTQHAVVFFKDKNNDWFAYARQDLRPQGGCAKPVVYLYPTQPTAVNVKVGADVKVSIPTYDAKRGWNALAFPNGTLVSGMGIYNSLFWEGPGHGAYPGVTSGSVVSREAAAGTIRAQLQQQGLNANEITDFMTYWEAKIPAKPYVRLTWFNTAQLNELAPLQITPKPDTLIRVFLDMEGYDQPIALPSQQLSSIPRTGFTAVEWGGLSSTKLY